MKLKNVLIYILLIILLASPLYSSPVVEQMAPMRPNYVQAENKANKEPTISEMLYILMSLYEHIDKNFLFEKDNNEMLYSMVEGMVNSLGDRYSYFTRPDDAQEYAEDNEGTFVGIGVYLQKMNPSLKDPENPETYMAIISSPFPSGPADRAGIRAKDLISHVNGVDISNMTADEAVSLIKGGENTPVTLTIWRNGASFDLDVIREEVKTPITTKTILEDNIGYLRLNSFPRTAEETIREDLTSLVSDGATSIILDLRNNGGGNMDDAINIANMFLDSGVIVSVNYKDTSTIDDTVYSATPYLAVPSSYPVVVLVNGGTASASEILTAALKENGRAVVVGQKTFGKGIVQVVYPFIDGFISLTFGEYFTPNGESIHEIGIVPDIAVELESFTDEDYDALEKFQKENPDAIDNWLKEYPEYTLENIFAFSDYYADSKVPRTILNLLVRNEYIYNDENYNGNGTVVDPELDEELKKAIEVIKTLK